MGRLSHHAFSVFLPFLGIALLISSLPGFAHGQVQEFVCDPGFVPLANAIDADPTRDLGFAVSNDFEQICAFRLSTGEELDRFPFSLSNMGAHLLCDPQRRVLMSVGSRDPFDTVGPKLIRYRDDPSEGNVFLSDEVIAVDFSQDPDRYGYSRLFGALPAFDGERGFLFVGAKHHSASVDSSTQIHAIDVLTGEIVDSVVIDTSSTNDLIDPRRLHFDPQSRLLVVMDRDGAIVVDAGGDEADLLRGASPPMQIPTYLDLTFPDSNTPALHNGLLFLNVGPASNSRILAHEISTGAVLASSESFSGKGQLAIDSGTERLFAADIGNGGIPRLRVFPVGVSSEVFTSAAGEEIVTLSFPTPLNPDRDVWSMMFDMDRDIVMTEISGGSVGASSEIFAHEILSGNFLDVADFPCVDFGTEQYRPWSRTIIASDVNAIVGFATCLVANGSPTDPLAESASVFSKPDGILFWGLENDLCLDPTDQYVTLAEQSTSRLLALSTDTGEMLQGHSLWGGIGRKPWHGAVQSEDRSLIFTSGVSAIWNLTPPPLGISHVTDVSPLSDRFNGSPLMDAERELVFDLVTPLSAGGPLQIHAVNWTTGEETSREIISDISPVYLNLIQLTEDSQRALLQVCESSVVYIMVPASGETMADLFGEVISSFEPWAVYSNQIESIGHEYAVLDPAGELYLCASVTDTVYPRDLMIHCVDAETLDPLCTRTLYHMESTSARRSLLHVSHSPDRQFVYAILGPPEGKPTGSSLLLRAPIDHSIPESLGEFGECLTLPNWQGDRLSPIMQRGNHLYLQDDDFITEVDTQRWRLLEPVAIPQDIYLRVIASDEQFALATGINQQMNMNVLYRIELDHEITRFDLILEALLGTRNLTPEEFIRADATGDDVIDIADLVQALIDGSAP